MESASAVPAWFGLLLQGGSFAVLVYLFVWGLPKIRKEIEGERKGELDTYLADNKEQRKEYKETLASIVSTFKAEAAAERTTCERHFETLAQAIGRGNEAVIQSVRAISEQAQQHAQRSQQWSEIMRAEVERLRKS